MYRHFILFAAFFHGVSTVGGFGSVGPGTGDQLRGPGCGGAGNRGKFSLCAI